MRSVFSLLVVVAIAASGCGTSNDADDTSPTPPTLTSVADITTTTTTPTTTAVPPTTAATTTSAAPTMTTAVPVSLADVEQAATAMWPEPTPDEWTCVADTDGDLGAGAVVTCLPNPVPTEGQHAILTGLILDDVGTISFAESGARGTIILGSDVMADLASGQFCRDILVTSEFERELGDPHLSYFGALLYWFLEDRPDRMDADVNGVPCETLFEASVVDSVWAGGLVSASAAG